MSAAAAAATRDSAVTGRNDVNKQRADDAERPRNATRRPAGTRSERVRELIEEGIATGEFPPGMRLDETELAERFDVSRTPLREALFQLASAGFVHMQPRRGTVVADVSPHRLVEMFEVMSELEAMCGRLAARRMSALDHQRLLEAHRACEQACRAADTDAYYYENERFHHLIYEGSRNEFLGEQASALHRRLRPYRRLQLRVRDRMPTSYREHEGIVEAIIAGDADLAAQRLREHVVVQGQRFADLVASLAGLHRETATQAAGPGVAPAAPAGAASRGRRGDG
jgi:DNA-binding GntR family transcriptional regulator